MKRAQISTQVFIYMLAVVILSITFLFGYKMVDYLKKNAEISAINDFKSQLNSVVNELSNECINLYMRSRARAVTLWINNVINCFNDFFPIPYRA